ncbi:MAG TPA: thioesterase family protein [Acidimicrobiales bacterium]|nr:thioesterase family protein [Acidimicrobiales bacterium]
MGDLEIDSRVVPSGEAAGDGTSRYTAKLSPDWAIWGPNGGYVASVALRAAGLATGRARPASIVAHFLGVAAFDEVDLTVTTLRSSRFATSARVSLTQGDRPILEALVWGLDPGGAALDHDAGPAPDVPPVEHVPSRDERIAALPADQQGPPPFPFFDNLDQHPVDWVGSWPPPGPLDPVACSWTRFRPTATFADPWVDACRLLIPIDTYGWPAASRAHAHVDPPEAVAVTVDLSVRFHRPAGDEWLLVETTSPVATGGLAAATGQVWDRAGTLLASGGQTMMCRPAS